MTTSHGKDLYLFDMVVIEAGQVSNLIGVDAVALQKTRNCNVLSFLGDLISQQVASLSLPELIGQTTTIQYSEESRDVIVVMQSHALLLSEL